MSTRFLQWFSPMIYDGMNYKWTLQVPYPVLNPPGGSRPLVQALIFDSRFQAVILTSALETYAYSIRDWLGEKERAKLDEGQVASQWTCACLHRASVAVGARLRWGGRTGRCIYRTGWTWQLSQNARHQDRRRSWMRCGCGAGSSSGHPDTLHSSWAGRDECCGSLHSGGVTARKTSACESISSPSVKADSRNMGHKHSWSMIMKNSWHKFN